MSAKGAPRPFTAGEEKLIKTLLKYFSAVNIWLYRISGGRIFGKWLRGAPIMLLTVIGRKSGQPRTVPLLYLADGDDVVVVASQGGMSTHPAWYLNLSDNPDCEVLIRGHVRKMRASRVSDDEKAELWPRLTAMYRDYDDYQARTERNIPVMRLSPR